jgi:CheY-like chemotaxis protein
VEDDPSTLALTTLDLEREGVDIVQVEDGGEALTVARERSPDVILLDISLPAMGGQQVLRRLKADPATASIPVICISAYNPQDYDSRGSAAQLVKPVSCEALVGEVERVLASGVGHNGSQAGSTDEGGAP